jgi:hypothetical protein
MDIINWGDFRRGTLAILLVIIPTLLLSNFIEPALQSHQITGPGLWQLKLSKVPDTVIEPLHVLRLKPYFLNKAGSAILNSISFISLNLKK